MGTSFVVCANRLGLEVSIQGFDDKLDLFVIDFLEELLKFRIKPVRFEIHLGVYTNMLKDYPTRSLPTLLGLYFDMIIRQSYFSFEELLSALPEITIENTEALLNRILIHSKIEMLVHGNVVRLDAIQLGVKVFETIHQNKNVYPTDPLIILDRNRELCLPAGCTSEYTVVNNIHESHALLVYTQVGVCDLQMMTQLKLFQQLINAAFFNQIRMTEQLAYVTYVYIQSSFTGTMGLSMVIQSTHETEFLKSRLQAFVDSVDVRLMSALFS